MSTFEVPLSAEPQAFSVYLGGTQYRMTLKWNLVTQGWTLDIADIKDTPIISGIALVVNTDLLAPYPYLNFGGKLIAQTVGDTTFPLTFDGLGTLGKLYFVT